MSDIRFQKIRYRNILSTGQTMTQVELDKSPSTMITGKNGSGKSTILDAVTFALFGKPFRKINKPQLVNTKNERDMLVEIDFKIRDNQYMVRRGIKPDLFEIYKNSEMLNQNSDSREYQRTLNNILGLDYQTFTQIVAIGKAQHVSFMKLDTGRRRLFVESILNLMVFSTMNRMHLQNVNRHKDRLKDIKSAITVSNEKINIRKKYIADLERELEESKSFQESESKSKIQGLRGKVEGLESEIRALEKVEPVDAKKMDSLGRKIREGENLVLKFDMKIEQMSNHLAAIASGDVCSSCGQKVPEEQLEKQRLDSEAKIEECKQARDSIQAQLSKQHKDFKVLSAQHSASEQYLKDRGHLESKIEDLEILIEETKSSAKVRDISYAHKIKEAKESLVGFVEMKDKLGDKLAELTADGEYNNIISMMLKDEGIKSVLIRKFVSMINRAINANLGKLGFFAKFTLDENFSETIEARGIDTMSYNNFSEGEKLRIDMAILLAWRDVAKLQSNVSTNLLILDEIADASMDTVGTEALVTMLAELRDSNVFIVTHSPDKMADKVRSLIHFKKVDGFSRMTT